MVHLLGSQVLKELSKLKYVKQQNLSTTQQVKLLDYLQRFSREEIYRKSCAVSELKSVAANIKTSLDNSNNLISIQQNHFLKIYKDIKLSLFLSEADPNVCLLFNDGQGIKSKKKTPDMFGFILHHACKERKGMPFTTIMLF